MERDLALIERNEAWATINEIRKASADAQSKSKFKTTEGGIVVPNT